MSQNKIIGNKIRQLRKLKKMTLENLASRLGISYGYLGQVERGETKANDDIFTGIFREFGVNIADLSGVPEPEDAEAKPVRQHIAINGLSCVKVEALKDLAEKLKETGDTEFYKLMGAIFMTLDELERKRLSGSLDEEGKDGAEEGEQD